MSNKKWRKPSKKREGEVRGVHYFGSQSELKGHYLRRMILGEEGALQREREVGLHNYHTPKDDQ